MVSVCPLSLHTFLLLPFLSSGLSAVRESYDCYVIVGGGKTGIDAVLHLLDHGVNPDRLTWIVPADSWFFNRDQFVIDENIVSFFESFFDGFSVETDQSWQDVYLR